MPEAEDLRGLLAEAQRIHGRLIELPWAAANESETLVLTVELKIGDAKPIWTLYRGDGPSSTMVWHSTETDFDLIFDIISMFMSEVEKEYRQRIKPVIAAPAPAPAEEVIENPTVIESSYFNKLTPIDFDLIKKQSNVLLGYMLVEAGLISPPVLDAALKLQEMVRDDTLTPLQACEALRRSHSRDAIAPEKASPPPSRPRTDSTEQQAVVDLLKQAGLVSEEDILMATNVRRKHGGDVGSILVSAKKIDMLTLQAAATCWPLIRDGLMKPEQAIIALHYCERSRVSFDEAINELGWERPSAR